MKKLNRKGFTLIELLAVIVVLAIVLVVTIPSVISSMNSAKTGQLENAASTVQKWFQDNYNIATVGGGVGTPEAAYSTFVNGLTDKKLPSTADSNIAAGSDVLKAAGITNPTGISGTVYVPTGTSTVCVILNASRESAFYNTAKSAEENKASAGC